MSIVTYKKIVFNLFGDRKESDASGVEAGVNSSTETVTCVYWNTANLQNLVTASNNARFDKIEGKIYPGFKTNPEKLKVVCLVLEVYHQNGISPHKFAIGVNKMFTREEWQQVIKTNGDLLKRYDQTTTEKFSLWADDLAEEFK